MKKLGNLNINSEKLIKDEELVNLRGGELTSYRCCCGMGSDTSCFYVNADSCYDATVALTYVCGDSGGGCFCEL